MLLRVLPLLATLLVAGFHPLAGQDNGCTGPSYAQLLRDPDGTDLRLTCVISYAGSPTDLLVGGMSGGTIVLSRIDTAGQLRWRRAIRTDSESTELTTLNHLLMDDQGMIAGVGGTFNDSHQRAFLFRYNPFNDQLEYFLQPDFPSEATGIHPGEDGEYIITGARINLPSPLFSRAYFQRVFRADGSPADRGRMIDLRGEERFLNVVPRPNGRLLAVGNFSVGSGAGGVRAAMATLDPTGKVSNASTGPIPGGENGRLYAYDVEVVGGKIYVLQWGNIGVITGSINTAMILSVFREDGTLEWTRRYDILEYNGEAAIEMEPHAGGLLIYGFSLVGKRDIYFVQLGRDGRVAWTRGYGLPGQAQLYPRSNQQLLAGTGGITALATYSFPGARSAEGLILRLDANGNSDNPCLEQLPITIESEALTPSWTSRELTSATETVRWHPTPAGTLPTPVTAYDDCDRPCLGCETRSFATLAICAGDSLRLAGRWRSRSGLYADTLAGTNGDCDSIAVAELLVSEGPTAEYRLRESCGLAEIGVTLLGSGGIPPYRYAWSAPGVSAERVDLLPGNYRVTVTDAPGCRPYVLAVDVEATTNTELTYAAVAPSCPGSADGAIELRPAGRGSLRLLTDSVATPDRRGGLAPGRYGFILDSGGGCEVYREVTVPAAADLQLAIRGPELVRLGDEAEFYTDAAALLYAWRTDGELSCSDCRRTRVRARTTTTVALTATDGRGCTVTDSLRLGVYRGPVRAFIPTAFSPNGDGTNDRWVPGLGPDVEQLEDWRVFDRWGKEVWALDPAAAGWWDGQGVAIGVYTWTLRGRLIDGTVFRRGGSVTLLR